MEWTEQAEQTAISMGWNVYLVGNDESNHLEIQRVDELQVFIDDSHAQRFVKAMAETDHENNLDVDVCRLAMKLLGEN